MENRQDNIIGNKTEKSSTSTRLFRKVSMLTDNVEAEQSKRVPDLIFIQKTADKTLILLEELVKSIIKDSNNKKELFYAYLHKAYMHHLSHDYDQAHASQAMMQHYAGTDIDLLMTLDEQVHFIRRNQTIFNLQH